MPRKSKKQTSSKSGKGDTSDDDSLFNDNASVISQASEGSYLRDEVGGDEIGQMELFEDKLKEAIDLAGQKSANGRVAALEGLCKAFSKKFVPLFAEDRYVTLTDLVERAVKRGKVKERCAGANLAVLLCVQLGLSESSEEVYKTLKPVFVATMNDGSVSPVARAAIANALGVCCFLAGGEIAELFIIMEAFEKIFSCSKVEASDETLLFHTAALSSWTLLLTMIPSSKACSMLKSRMEHLGILLSSRDVDLRISAGEAMVVLFESAADHDEEEAFASVDCLYDRLKELATDSNKHRSKKDRKEQRSSFRDILKTIDDGEDYYEKLSINSRETLSLNNWTMKKQYDSLCKSLLSGVNLHLTENELLRDIFFLGPPLPEVSSLQKNRQKHEKQLVNSQAFKYRTRTRGKERDKRSVMISS